MRAYKVVRDDGKKYKPAICMARVPYEIGKWTVPPEEADDEGYGLLVFSTLKDAKAFILGSFPGYRKIFLCEVRGVYKNLPPRRFAYTSSPWLEGVGLGSWPLGTLMVSAVKLLEEVK
jgi:hypothetical protein